ncbi:hypothetical protein CY34DRAFT_352218 [Suillus luteus UH-Slu-Lm8-n1]|uniref:Uncharacterized protein n=1 Tax=Suillus luteus UH-Slu-Lm8-n1 TaxID=930992 RepID=A0A0D0ABD7_9AGAM|nr:hypothetical protein CY34DRAFT_352218 [Suillus luteus UH-Slu-Lm8-n1]
MIFIGTTIHSVTGLIVAHKSAASGSKFGPRRYALPASSFNQHHQSTLQTWKWIVPHLSDDSDSPSSHCEWHHSSQAWLPLAERSIPHCLLT